jgi:cytochrome P450
VADPETFDPHGSLAMPRTGLDSYLPFGGGRRICIGQSFALVEMVLMAAMISQRFPFDVCPDHGVELETTLTLRPKHGLRVVAHRREEPADERSTG